MTDATRTIVGVSEVMPNPRDAALAEIAAKANAQKEESGEFAEFDEDTGEVKPREEKTEEKPVEAPETPPVEEEQGEEEQTEPDPPKPDEADETVTLRVDGKEVHVPKSKILDAGVRTLQKEVAADKRLEEATRLLRVAQESQRELQRMQQPPQPSDQDVANAIAQALRQGDEAQAQAAISALLNAGRQQTIQPEAIHQIVAQEVEASAALNSFRSDFSDVVSDPYLMRLAVDLEDQRLARVAQGLEPNRPLVEAFKEHGEAIRKWRGLTPNTMETKREAKASIQPVKAASLRAPTPKPDKPETTEQIIEKMRRSRNQRIA